MKLLLMVLFSLFSIQAALAEHVHFHAPSELSYVSTDLESSSNSSQKESDGNKHVCHCYQHNSGYMETPSVALREPAVSEGKFTRESETPDFFLIQLLFRPPCA